MFGLVCCGVVDLGGAVRDGVALNHKLIGLLHVGFFEGQPAQFVLPHELYQRVELGCFEESRVPKGSSEWLPLLCLDIVFGPASGC